MSIHLNRDMEEVHQEILAQSAIVEQMIDMATQVMMQRRLDLVEQVTAMDRDVDRREVHIEELCLKMLALHQPVAIDLRRIATVMKVNNDLERVADLAVNFAERAGGMHQHRDFPVPARLPQMITHATQMVRGALDCFVNLESRAARHILRLDDEVDQMNVEVIHALQDTILSQPSLVEPALHCFSASRQIERIADHATNIAEDVIYLVEGEIVRHRHLPEIESD